MGALSHKRWGLSSRIFVSKAPCHKIIVRGFAKSTAGNSKIEIELISNFEKVFDLFLRVSL
jgi:hypothetical protein